MSLFSGHEPLPRAARSGHKRLPSSDNDNLSLNSYSASALSKRAICQLYTSPSTSTTLNVYEPVTITWNTTCDYSLGTKIDLYLNVDTATDGSQAVHEWTGQAFSSGSLTTELKPSWWNASTGAGSVQAQVSGADRGVGLGEEGQPRGRSEWQADDLINPVAVHLRA